MTSMIFEATIGCEFITPLFPQHFLALASMANVGKAIALAAFVATAPAFQQALCAGGWARPRGCQRRGRGGGG